VLVLILLLPDVFMCDRLRPGDAGTRHLERIENGVKLLAGEQLIAQDRIADRCSRLDGLARNARCSFVPNLARAEKSCSMRN
jgi:hypothetical protein